MEDIGSDVFREHLLGAMDAPVVDILLQALRQEASVSVRLNPFKPCEPPEGASRVPWSPHGYMLADRPVFTLDPLMHAGAYYVQDSSSMFVGHLVRTLLPEIASGVQGRPLRVLDLCAAPGGKTTDMAASLREALGAGGSILVANEVMRPRAGVLSDNVARWGDPGVAVTSCDPAALGRMEGWFDLILADVPCSGEGMFRKDARAVREWSPRTVELCSARQRRIVADVWPALREGGVLIYSTCTFVRQENDANVLWVCESLGAELLTGGGVPPFDGVLKTDAGYLLVPGLVPGEGQYAAALRRTSPQGLTSRALSDISCLRPLWTADSAAALPAGGGAPPEDLALRVDFDRDAWPVVEVDRMTALRYLHRDSFALPDAPRGYVVVSYLGHPLGFVKNLGSRCNNLHPMSRRILMDINR